MSNSEVKYKAKLVIIGDGGCGKTSLLHSIVENKFYEDYVPTIFETYYKDVTADDGRTVEMSFWDTAGQETYNHIRPISYPDTDIILLCFSVINKGSLNNAQTKWYPEVRDFCGSNIPIVLVGTKMDLRQEQSEQSVSPEDGRVLAKEIQAVGYLECSSKTTEGVSQVLQTTVKAVLKHFDEKRRKSRKRRFPCQIL